MARATIFLLRPGSCAATNQDGRHTVQAARSFLIGYDLDLDRKSLIVRECVSAWLSPDVASIDVEIHR
jgi:hypothetical protein